MDSERKNLAPTRPQGFGGLMLPVPTAATYDTGTEGKSGWRFLITGRWIAFVIGAAVYLAGCVGGVVWQASIGQQIATFNATVSRNFDAPAVPLGRVLSSLSSYTASRQWKPVTVTGTYLSANQLYVRARTCGADTGFEVLTPLTLADGRQFIIDRGCVDASAANPNTPVAAAAAPVGTVTVTARIVASESAKGSVTAGQADERGTNQVDSIDLASIAARGGVPTYTGAYGLLVSQSPAPARSLHPVLTGKPTIDASLQAGTIFATVLYVIVGLVIFGYALREKFRFVNRFDPRLWAREWKRIQRLARKPYTDAETEDLLIDGYPLGNIRAIEVASKQKPERELHR